MRRYSGGSRNISGILWMALAVLIVCVSATFFHVYDIESLFKKQAEDAFLGHVETAVSEIEYDTDYVKTLLYNFTEYVEESESNDDIQM